jgi:hypothetical protein
MAQPANLTKNQLLLTDAPIVVIICQRCSVALTKPAVWTHMVQFHTDFSRVISVFASPSELTAPLPGVPISQMIECPACKSFFTDYDVLLRHSRIVHPQTSPVHGTLCGVQEIKGGDGKVSWLHVISASPHDGDHRSYLSLLTYL